MAAELTVLCLDWKGRPLSYETPDLDEVFHAEVNLKMKPMTRRRLTEATERRATAFELTPEEVKQQIAKKISRKEEQLKDVGVTLQDQAGAVYELFRIACTQSMRTPGDEFHFWNIETVTQRALIEHAMTNADRAEDRATENDRLSDREYDDISMTVLKVNKELKTVLQSPRFTTQALVAEAG